MSDFEDDNYEKILAQNEHIKNIDHYEKFGLV
jgi:hypothetical protein